MYIHLLMKNAIDFQEFLNISQSCKFPLRLREDSCNELKNNHKENYILPKCNGREQTFSFQKGGRDISKIKTQQQKHRLETLCSSSTVYVIKSKGLRQPHSHGFPGYRPQDISFGLALLTGELSFLHISSKFLTSVLSIVS